MYAFKHIDRLCNPDGPLSCEKKAACSVKGAIGTAAYSTGLCLKSCRYLEKAHILEGVTGIDGGMRLVKHPRDIPIYDVIQAMETTMQINRCLEKDCYCSCNAVSFCQVRHFYEKIQLYLDDLLLSTSVQDLLEME